jgi:hypothetical protein
MRHRRELPEFLKVFSGLRALPACSRRAAPGGAAFPKAISAADLSTRMMRASVARMLLAGSAWLELAAANVARGKHFAGRGRQCIMTGRYRAACC